MPARKNLRINEIVEVGYQEFLRSGYEGLTLAAVAERLGVHTAAIKYHVGTKDDLLVLVRDRVYEPVRALMNRAAQNPDALAGLSKFIRDYMKFWAKHPRERVYWLMAVGRMLENKQWWPYSNEHTLGMVTWYFEMLRRGDTEGRFKHAELMARATTLFCAVEGALPYVAMARTFSLKKVSARLERVLLAEMKGSV